MILLVIYLKFSRRVTSMIIALVEIKKGKIGAEESKSQNKVGENEVVVGDDDEVGDDTEVVRHLHREKKELREENPKLKKEVENINARKVRLKREKIEKEWQVLRMQDQLDAMQGEPLHREREVMNYYLLYNQRFIDVHGSNVV